MARHRSPSHVFAAGDVWSHLLCQFTGYTFKKNVLPFLTGACLFQNVQKHKTEPVGQLF
jgi:hypothetical protein